MVNTHKFIECEPLFTEKVGDIEFRMTELEGKFYVGSMHNQHLMSLFSHDEEIGALNFCKKLVRDERQTQAIRERHYM